MVPVSPTVFVCGITGNQGGALAKHLLQLKWKVHATARDLQSPRAIALSAAGVNLTQGDWDDGDALRTSIVGCSKLFLNLMSTMDDPDREHRQAARIVRIAKDVGVEQVVSSTSLGVSLYGVEGHLAGVLDPGTALYSFVKVKKAVEKTVLEGGFDSCTFLRPGYFMANFLEPMIEGYPEILIKGTWSTVFKADTRLGLIDHDDIAKFAVAAFQDKERFNGNAIGLVSEFLTPQETLDRLGEAMGRSGLKAIFLSDKEISALPAGSFDNPYVKGDKCLEHMAQLVDMDEIAAVIQLTSFGEFLRREKTKIMKL